MSEPEMITQLRPLANLSVLTDEAPKGRRSGTRLQLERARKHILCCVLVGIAVAVLPATAAAQSLSLPVGSTGLTGAQLPISTTGLTGAQPPLGVTGLTTAQLPTGASTAAAVDSPPTLMISGQLYDRANTALYADNYPLDISATGGSSGVRSLSVSVDGTTLADASRPCTMVLCPPNVSLNTILSGSAYAPGSDHTVVVRATDLLGQTTTRSWTFAIADFHPLLTEAEATAQAIKFRTDFGLQSDSAYVRGLLEDPDQAAAIDEYGTPVTSQESQQLDRYNARSTMMQTADDWALTNDPSTYAGVWQTPDGDVHVAFTSGAASAIASLRMLVPDPNALIGETASNSLASLTSLQNAIATDGQMLASDGVHVISTNIDVADNVVEVGVDDTAQDGLGSNIPSGTQQTLTDLFGPSAIAVATSEVQQDSGPLSDNKETREDPTPPAIGGLAVDNTSGGGCTFGFPVTYEVTISDALQIASYNTYHSGWITAGHCDYGSAGWTVAPGPGDNLGTSLATTVDGEFNPVNADALLVQDGHRDNADSPMNPNIAPYIYDEPGKEYAIAHYKYKMYPGQMMCLSQRFSYGTKCGVVTSNTQEAETKNSKITIEQLGEVDLADGICVGGDSGSPAFELNNDHSEATLYGIEFGSLKNAESICQLSQLGNIEHELFRKELSPDPPTIIPPGGFSVKITAITVPTVKPEG